MANPVDPNLLVRNWRSAGIDIFENSGWQTHNRDAGREPFRPNGIMIHHVGGDTNNPDLYASKTGVLWVGRSDLPGPLCLAGVGMQGRIYMEGFGRTNHAGTGDSNVLNAVINETVPMDRELRPTQNNVDGNSRFYGFECIYSGGHPMTDAGYWATVKAAAVICRMHGWSARSVIGHREWTNTKPDPGYCPMDKFRRDVQAILDGNSSGGDDLDMWTDEAMFDVINRACIGVFRSEEARGIIKQEAINALNLPLDRGGLPPEAGDTSVLAVASWSDANLDGIRRAISAVDAKADATLAAVTQIANDPDVSLEAVKQAVQEAVANSVEVAGNLTVVSKRAETPVVPEAQPQS